MYVLHIRISYISAPLNIHVACKRGTLRLDVEKKNYNYTSLIPYKFQRDIYYMVRHQTLITVSIIIRTMWLMSVTSKVRRDRDIH